MQNPQPRARSRAARNLMRSASLLLLFVVATGQASAEGCVEVEPAPAPRPPATSGGGEPSTPPPTNPVTPSAPVAPSPGHVRGRVTDSRGGPLSRVEMVIQSSTTGGYGSTVNAVTDANGMYEVRIPDAQWIAYAWIPVHYQGETYRLGLDPAEGDWRTGDSQSGLVRNFVWKISGEVPRAADPKDPNSYYGGAFHLSGLMPSSTWSYPQTGEPSYPAGSSVEVTLTPNGALIDGSQGRTLRFTRTYPGGYSYSRGELGEEYFLDIPIGTYTVTATVTEPGGATYPARVAVEKSGERASDFASSLLVTIPPRKGLSANSPYMRRQVENITLYVLR